MVSYASRASLYRRIQNVPCQWITMWNVNDHNEILCNFYEKEAIEALLEQIRGVLLMKNEGYM